jgi:valyl-tRNA synthetase
MTSVSIDQSGCISRNHTSLYATCKYGFPLISISGNSVPFGVLIDFAYKLKDDPNREIIVSTTRIETMLGDVAVCVHPDDPRYKDIIGKELIHPFFPDRKMIIIADSVLVDMDFGTGAVKITPGHDPNDFACGQRHNLPIITIFNDDGTLNENGSLFKGMKRYDCRNAILKELDKLGLYRGKKPNKMILQTCSKYLKF